MGFDKTMVPKVMAAVLSQTRTVLASEADLDVDSVADCRWDAPALHLCRHSALAGLGGSLGLLVAFSFEPALLDTLYDRMAAAVGGVPAGEEELYRRETAAETVNTVLGLSTSDLCRGDAVIPLTPPVVLAAERRIDRPSQATIASTAVRTGSGVLDISIIAPGEAFRHLLDYPGEVTA